jgi:hypothetical protein
LRTGSILVVIRKLIYHSRYGPARETQLGREQLEKVQLDKDQLFARDRHLTDRIFLCL